MAKIVFITVYEHTNMGGRLLASYMRSKGHLTHSIILKKFNSVVIEGNLNEESHGYQMVSNGKIYEYGVDICPITSLELELLEEVIRKQQPDILGIGVRSSYDFLMPTLIPAFRHAAPNALIVGGGFGPTLEPELYLDMGFDVVVRCDGEEALLDLANTYSPTYTGSNIKYAQIENTSWKIEGKYIHNKLRSQEKNISKYPHALYGDEHFSFIDGNILKENFDPCFHENKYYTLIGRGCIGSCTYCCGGQWANLYRKEHIKFYKRRNREVEDVLSELLALDKEKTIYIEFIDELFVMPKKKAREFFYEYKKIGIPFFMYLNYEMVVENEDLFELICSAGLVDTSIGIQHGSEDFAKNIYNRNTRNSCYLKYANMLFDNNIKTQLHIIGGNCYETEEYFQINLDFVKQLPFSITNPQKSYLLIIRLKVHPGTPISTIAPKLLTHPVPMKKYVYRAFLLHFRRILDDDAFEELRARSDFKDNPAAMQKYYKKTILNLQQNYFSKLVEELQGQRVVFYGATELYQKNKHLFASLKPECMLMDKKYAKDVGKSIDGIPMYQTEDFMKDNPQTKIITFAHGSLHMQRKLVRVFGMKNEDIHTCTSVLY